MKLIFVAAEKRKIPDAHIAVCQVVSGKGEPGGYDILTAGAVKKRLVQMLKIGQAEIQGRSQFRNLERSGGIVVNLRAQGGKIRIIFLNGLGGGLPFQLFL